MLHDDKSIHGFVKDRFEEINVNVDTWATCEIELLGKEAREKFESLAIFVFSLFFFFRRIFGIYSPNHWIQLIYSPNYWIQLIYSPNYWIQLIE